MFKLFAVVFSILVLSQSAYTKPEKIILWEHLWPDRNSVKILLDNSVDKFGPYTLSKSVDMEQGRAIESLINNTFLNIIYLPASKSREKKLLPVYIYMGEASLGYRVLLIKKGEQVVVFKDWRISPMCTGSHGITGLFPVIQILYSVKLILKVIKNAKYEGLYRMLAGGRFDSFPRGICQIKRKIKKFGPNGLGLPIVYEKKLLFVYPFKTILFVSRKNPKLKNRLLYGYKKALKKKQWPGELIQDCPYKEYSFLKLSSRIIIPLKNPYISEKIKNLKTYGFNPFNKKD